MSRKIGLVLQGGLGNQLFIFASGYALAADSGQLDRIRLVDLWYQQPENLTLERSMRRKFELHRFPAIKKSFPKARFLKQIASGGAIIIGSRHGMMGASVLTDFEDVTRIASDPRVKTLYGYFRDQSLFAPHRDALLRLLALKDAESELVSQLEASLRSQLKGFVAVHVRRGDLAKRGTQSDLLPIEYYKSAIDSNRPVGSKVVIFSDSPQWCKNVPIFQNELILDMPDPVLAMTLMARADCLIMSRSTLSYWSGWISDPRATQVITPVPFLLSSDFNWDANLLPEWQKCTLI